MQLHHKLALCLGPCHCIPLGLRLPTWKAGEGCGELWRSSWALRLHEWLYGSAPWLHQGGLQAIKTRKDFIR
ncbi:hypothetical protein AAY473_016368 [Plecturocebus cupreus]